MPQTPRPGREQRRERGLAEDGSTLKSETRRTSQGVGRLHERHAWRREIGTDQKLNWMERSGDQGGLGTCRKEIELDGAAR